MIGLRERLEAAEKNGVPVLVVSVADLRELYIQYDTAFERAVKANGLLIQIYEGLVKPSDIGG